MTSVYYSPQSCLILLLKALLITRRSISLTDDNCLFLKDASLSLCKHHWNMFRTASSICCQRGDFWSVATFEVQIRTFSNVHPFSVLTLNLRRLPTSMTCDITTTFKANRGSNMKLTSSVMWKLEVYCVHTLRMDFICVYTVYVYWHIHTFWVFQ